MSLTRLKWSMSRIATAIGVRLRAARLARAAGQFDGESATYQQDASGSHAV